MTCSILVYCNHYCYKCKYIVIIRVYIFELTPFPIWSIATIFSSSLHVFFLVIKCQIDDRINQLPIRNDYGEYSHSFDIAVSPNLTGRTPKSGKGFDKTKRRYPCWRFQLFLWKLNNDWVIFWCCHVARSRSNLSCSVFPDPKPSNCVVSVSVNKTGAPR